MNAGTKDEHVSCRCELGYSGRMCDECKHGYYRDENSASFSCKMSDKACKDTCKGPGPKSCETCSDGHYFLVDKSCVQPKSLEMVQNLSEGEQANKIKIQNQDVNANGSLMPAEHSEL
ncbi:cysteine-rich with EGF-like domain protein 2 [Nephila pilipes]|uniref:Cysteine-rich with EGF-like domain protein 2 n=1 Tax=Nephila pilipes TaxID=299642 RepID=A0A8X6UMB6_NEPPI|nr:cysteine-rich with EGF-like domain protein 2 [Nephila pilipes]